jgi:hypothetical protein
MIGDFVIGYFSDLRRAEVAEEAERRRKRSRICTSSEDNQRYP